MTDPWTDSLQLWQTSPSVPTDRCDLVLVRTRGTRLVALVVDGAPGRSLGRPHWPRETLYRATLDPFLDEDDPAVMLATLGDHLHTAYQGKPSRMFAAATALCWDAADGDLQLAEVGDTKAWLLSVDDVLPLTGGGIPRPGYSPPHMLGARSPDIRTHRAMLSSDGATPGDAVAILTDGGYDVLTSLHGDLPDDLDDWRIDRIGRDDATLLLIDVPGRVSGEAP